jgi:hypothetical protein
VLVHEKQNARGSLGCFAGISETLNVDLKLRAQVTSAREACDSGNNKRDLA